MAIPTRTARPGTYFVTSLVANRRRVFQVTRNAELLLETLDHYRENYLLHAYVVMPDHIHLLLTPTQITLERTMQLIKGGFSYRFHASQSVWQRGFTDHRIRNAEEYVTRLAYIAQNPVRARLCTTAEEYPYSSVNPTIRLDEYLSG
ncbi:REP-associated tyrosine transposase [Terriglobus albidus]|uniref:REP-associated tyrosine transposase n=1 Tax=Terriglobus albidus TaxID=1592106 RepID=UPI0021DF9E39|nr:transposase [Terriglobus albidus]